MSLNDATFTPPADPSVVPPNATDDALLLAFLRDRDAACPLCGYNLRGLASNRCPECGRDIRLAVAMTEPFLRAWVTLAVVAFAGAGVGLLYLMLVMSLGWPRFERAAVIGPASIIYFFVMIPVSAIVIVSRRRFVRMASGAQWTTAISLAVMSLFVFFLSIALIQ